MNSPAFLFNRSATLLAMLLLTGCSCFKSHNESCIYSQYTHGLDDTPMVRMAELGILMRERNKYLANQNRIPADIVEEAGRAREDACSTAEFDKQVEIFNEVLERRIEGYKNENRVYFRRLAPCVAPLEKQQTTNTNAVVN